MLPTALLFAYKLVFISANQLERHSFCVESNGDNVPRNLDSTVGLEYVASDLFASSYHDISLQTTNVEGAKTSQSEI